MRVLLPATQKKKRFENNRGQKRMVYGSKTRSGKNAAECCRMVYGVIGAWRTLSGKRALLSQSGPAQGTLHSARTPPVGSQQSCQPTVKLHVLPLVWFFSSEEGVVWGAGGRSLNLPCGSTPDPAKIAHDKQKPSGLVNTGKNNVTTPQIK